MPRGYEDEDVLTVEEAARVLRIGRGAAYRAARQWRKTKGREGLPVIVVGGSLRVPAVVLDRMLEMIGAEAAAAVVASSAVAQDD